jgi:hypothetical protein
MWRAFERKLAAGLQRGQVLRCRTCTARAENPAAPGVGPWIVDLGGMVHTMHDPHAAARMWHLFLSAEVHGDGTR